MAFLYTLCESLTVGLVAGFVFGAFRLIKRPRYSEQEALGHKKLRNILTTSLKYVTLLALLLGLVWCGYFLAMGALLPQQAEYASALSQLIVSVLTVISILFAFFEFVSSKNT